ncbi:FecR family protein [Pedobacter mendelii]|uniref:Iron dicitrate transporter FecR n=1 Tax=Pedobacter mendelii TaxID=1908240 RepID=A0ABQ2BFD9_9SPHI|nr:FecR family protein [Pedobacter mendelii]GGI24889.1 iron dicitrate transporter FecR [Pedobacter mendelii]
MKTDQAKSLLKKYIDENTNPKEQYLIDSFIEEQLLSNSWDASETEKQALGLKVKQLIENELFDNKKTVSPKAKSIKLWQISAAAAVIAVFILGGLYLVKIKNESFDNRFANDIKPGGNEAVLTLSDGRKINLATSKTGELAKLDGISIKKSASGLLVFSVLNAGKNPDSNKYNTIETPLGGQYQVDLPDGTKVWLNAGTKLKFPNHFAGAKRIIELGGEAYFEVAKDKNHPFLVNSATQEVEVLGTHFNINSYSNEPVVKTTLLEGAVKVSNSNTEKIIAPGEQAILSGSHFDVRQIDPITAVDWKNGEFRFQDESLKSILRKLSRWYGVKFVLEEGIDNLPAFSGSVSRFDQISVVLKMLEETGNIKFYINGNIVTVK